MFFIKRIGTFIITIFLVSLFCFLAFSVIRGDPASFLGGIWLSPEEIELLREEMGLNRNVFIRYFDWLTDILSGNLGHSLRFRGEPIFTMISVRMPISCTIAIMSLAMVLVISLPVSLLTVKREAGFVDRIVNFFTAAGISAPGFFLGLLFIWIFGFTMKLFIPGLYIDYSENIFSFVGSLFFPALAIAIPNSAIMIKFLRGSLFHELKSDYVRTARSKGASWFYIMYRHVLKNAMIPAITVFGMIIAEVFAGSIIIEQVFSIPGIGRLLIAAITSRDYPVIQALIVYMAYVVVTANTFADLVIMFVDPRIRQTKRKIR